MRNAIIWSSEVFGFNCKLWQPWLLKLSMNQFLSIYNQIKKEWLTTCLYPISRTPHSTTSPCPPAPPLTPYPQNHSLIYLFDYKASPESYIVFNFQLRICWQLATKKRREYGHPKRISCLSI